MHSREVDRQSRTGLIFSVLLTVSTSCLVNKDVHSAKVIIMPSNNMKLVHWPLMGRLLHLENGRGRSVQINVLLYSGPMLCGIYRASAY